VAQGLQGAMLEELVGSLLVDLRQGHIVLQALENLALEGLHVQADPALFQK